MVTIEGADGLLSCGERLGVVGIDFKVYSGLIGIQCRYPFVPSASGRAVLLKTTTAVGVPL